MEKEGKDWQIAKMTKKLSSLPNEQAQLTTKALAVIIPLYLF